MPGLVECAKQAIANLRSDHELNMGMSGHFAHVKNSTLMYHIYITL